MRLVPMAMAAALWGTAVAPLWAEEEPPGLTAHLTVNRTEFHPGEFVHMQGFVRNESDSKRILPELINYRTHYLLEPLLAEIHLATPQGDEYVYDPLQLQTDRPKLTARHFRAMLDRGEEMQVRDLRLRLTDGLADWVRRDDTSPERPQLRRAGDYRLWFVYRVPAVDEAPQGAWAGAVRSDAVTIRVRELPPDERLDRPTEEQLAAVNRFLEQWPAYDSANREFIQEAMLRAENEGLAAHLVELWQQDVRSARNLANLVALRAGHRDQGDPNRDLLPGIDGPYLETLARLTVEAFESLADPPETRPADRRPDGWVEPTVVWLSFHPEETELRDRFVKILEESAPLRAVEVQPFPGDREGRPPLGPPRIGGSGPVAPVTAWRALLDLDVLHVGMTRDEALDLLGEPNQRWTSRLADDAGPDEPDETIGWYLQSPRRANDGLRATLRDGKVIGFQLFRG